MQVWVNVCVERAKGKRFIDWIRLGDSRRREQNVSYLIFNELVYIVNEEKQNIILVTKFYSESE